MSVAGLSLLTATSRGGFVVRTVDLFDAAVIRDRTAPRLAASVATRCGSMCRVRGGMVSVSAVVVVDVGGAASVFVVVGEGEVMAGRGCSWRRGCDRLKTGSSRDVWRLVSVHVRNGSRSCATQATKRKEIEKG